MTRYLVVYYSWTGNTKKVAKAVAGRLGADLEAIVEQHPHSGVFARFWCAFDSIFRRRPPILPAGHDVGDYDVVILGSPVWAADMAAPMRTFLAREKGRIAKAAFFCTYGGAGGSIALQRMAEASGALPLTILLLTQEELERTDWRADVESFVDRMSMTLTADECSARELGKPSQPLPVGSDGAKADQRRGLAEQ